MRRIERLINLIAALLETSRPLTSEEIRQRIAGYEGNTKEGFRRAFERDKQDLRAVGIPIELKVIDPITEAEGYYIPKDRYYLPQLDLEPDELAALRIAAASLIGDEESASMGALKLSIDTAGDPIARPPFVWGSEVAAESAALGAVYSAVVEGRPVTFTYDSGSGPEERSLEPYAIAYRRGRWYVVGRDVSRDAIRSFRAARITGNVRKQEGTFRTPDRFDVDEHLGAEAFAVGAGPETARVRFDESIRWWAERNLDRYPQVNAPDGGLDVEVPLGNVDALVSFVIGFGAQAEIVAPAEARRALVEHVTAHV